MEISRSLRHARVFNLDRDTLQRTVLDPWSRGAPVALGDREWDPRESDIKILEGPELPTPDLAIGRAWSNAEHSAQNVTVEVISRALEQGRAASTVAVLATSSAAEAAVLDALGSLGVPQTEWKGVRDQILSAATAPADGVRPAAGEPAAVVVAADGAEPSASWQFEAGLALGALGAAAILVRIGDGPPPAGFEDLSPIGLDPANPEALEALAERLRLVGIPIERQA